MNKLYRSLMILVLTLGLALALEQAAPVEASTLRSSSAHISTSSTRTTVKATAQGRTELDRWLSTCSKVASTIQHRGFRYSYGNTKKSLSKALRKGRKANCAAYASWCLQQFGALKTGKVFYTRGGSIHKSFSSWGSDIKVIKVYRKSKYVSLQPGDIVCWTFGHINIYTGRSSSGKRLWYDGGRNSVRGHRNGGRYTSIARRKSINCLKNRKISYIIRIKNLDDPARA